jgi:hypothetical protein
MDEETGVAWTRKHDLPGQPYLPKVHTVYPTSLDEVVRICTDPSYGPLHAAGSHWALSDAAVSDGTFIETHDPAERHQILGLGKTLYDVVPGCMDAGLLDSLAHSRADNLFVHVEAGKRIYQLYSELDYLADSKQDDPKSLREKLRQRGNAEYEGPWALETLGGAGGQTIFGALNTGTHGGDIRLPPIADSVVAMHLVVDGGQQYWIEPDFVVTGVPGGPFHLVDEDQLQRQYPNVQVIRDDELFNAVLVSVGRFGVVYSVVLKAVRQYSLREVRELSTWQDVKDHLADSNDPLYGQRFLQLGVSVTPHHNFTRNLCGITRRSIPAGALDTDGRDQRRGNRSADIDDRIQAYRFSSAGNNVAYDPGATEPSFLDIACANGNFLVGVLEAVAKEVEKFLSDNTVEVGGALAATTALGGAPVLISLGASLAAILALLLAAIAAYRAATGSGDLRFATVMDDIRSKLLDNPDPVQREAGILVWQSIAYEAFKQQQSPHDYTAISYAVMDSHNYQDVSCEVNVDSIEVFFAANDPNLPVFIDALLTYEATQEVMEGKAFVGYISLRFTGPTRALLGMQAFPRTCAVEVACLKDVAGSQELLAFASALARDRNIRGIIHWGQRNDCTAAEIEDRFGDASDPTWIGDKLSPWRRALHHIVGGDRFSTEFTRRLGLE